MFNEEEQKKYKAQEEYCNYLDFLSLQIDLKKIIELFEKYNPDSIEKIKFKRTREKNFLGKMELLFKRKQCEVLFKDNKEQYRSSEFFEDFFDIIDKTTTHNLLVQVLDEITDNPIKNDFAEIYEFDSKLIPLFLKTTQKKFEISEDFNLDFDNHKEIKNEFISIGEYFHNVPTVIYNKKSLEQIEKIVAEKSRFFYHDFIAQSFVDFFIKVNENILSKKNEKIDIKINTENDETRNYICLMYKDKDLFDSLSYTQKLMFQILLKSLASEKTLSFENKDNFYELIKKSCMNFSIIYEYLTDKNLFLLLENNLEKNIILNSLSNETSLNNKKEKKLRL